MRINNLERLGASRLLPALESAVGREGGGARAVRTLQNAFNRTREERSRAVEKGEGEGNRPEEVVGSVSVEGWRVRT